MISVGSRDGREGVGLGFGAGSDMEETELEEGEAFSYQTDDYSTIDPDVALSYIDVKIQDVLGHFQKDFEGGVSAENLGAKFGGYGSFLPTYQRSPVSTHPRTPAKVHNSNTPASPNNLHLEGSHRNSVVPPSTSLLVRHGQASETAASLPLVRACLNDSAKRDMGVSSAHFAEESTSASELGKKYTLPSDQKSLKVRIKVGSDNLSTKKKAEIYSGLGLDLSPTSSSDNIPSDSEGFPHEPQEGHDESPTSILQIMTSFPVHGNLLLSPLADDLVYLMEKERSHGESKPRSLQKGGKGSSHRSDYARSEDKVVEANMPNLFEKNAHSVELKNLNNKGTQDGKGILLKKETEIQTGDCDVLVANALKLPLLSDSCSNVDESTKHNPRAVDDSMVVNSVKEECLDAVSTQEIQFVEKPSGKAASAGKVWDGMTATLNGDKSFYPRKDGNIKGEKCDVSAKGDLDVPKGRKAQNGEPVDPLEQKIRKNSTPLERDDMKLASGKENSSSRGKKKSKGHQNHSAKGAEIPKDSLRKDSSSVTKNKKRAQADSYLPQREMTDPKVQKDNGKASDVYRDFFGDIELEEGDNDVDSAELLSVDEPKDLEPAEKSTFSSNSMLKQIPNGKKMDERLLSDAYSKAASGAAPVAGNGSISDAATGTSAPLVKDNWVCCDNCQKWRLLPLGTNPDSLPEKWLCIMLYWLPGMNRCSVSEEETTKALTAQYQIPAPMNQNNLQGRPLPLADANHSEQNGQSFTVHAMPDGGKKKNGIRDVSGPLSQAGPAPLKKNLQQLVNGDGLNGVDKSPPASDIEPTLLSNSTIVEKPRHRPKEKNKPLEQHSDGGETKSSKIRSKRDNDQDGYRDSKKTKIDHGVDFTDADLSDHDGRLGKVGPSSSSVLSVNASGKDSHNNGDHCPKAGRCEANNSSEGAHRKPKEQVQVISGDRCLDIVKENDKDLDARKRKMNGSHDRSRFLEQTSENLHKKEKRARVSKSESKETSVSRNSDGSVRKVRRSKDQKLGPDLTERSLDAMDSLRRDSGSLQPSQAATSSSSKVSGSRKSKSNMQERKSSPVESVSSSPLRFSHPDKSAPIGMSQDGKNGFGNAGLDASGSPIRGTAADDQGSNRSNTVGKDETFVNNQKPLDSFMFDLQERDMGHLAGSEAKIEILKSADFANGTDTLGNGTHYPYKSQGSDQRCDEKRGSDKQYHVNASRSRKSGKSSSSRSRDKNGNSKSALDKGKVKISGSDNGSFDHLSLYGEKSRAGKNRVQENFGANLDEAFSGKKEHEGKVVGENCKRENQSKFDQVGSSDVKVEAVSGKTDRAEGSGRGKLHTLPPSGRGQNDVPTHSLSSNPGSKKEGGGNGFLNEASEGGNALKVPKQNHKSDDQNGNQLSKSRHATANGHRVRDADAPSPARRDSSNPATNAVKEAKDLKHLADRLKNSGSSAESTGLYFQAALKFLHGASLLESTNGDSAKQSDMIQSMQIYSSTAKLCEFCAYEYEKSKDMAAAALAYKCTEVAYMRVIYSSRSGASRDRKELQQALQIVPPGESPSSSASDVDNVNSLATLDKVPLSKGVGSPQVAGNHVIPAQNRPSFSRLLHFTLDVNSAMEASRKSRLAFAAANLRKEEAQNRDGIPSVKTALDFSFQDVEGLLHLVRLAMEAIGR